MNAIASRLARQWNDEHDKKVEIGVLLSELVKDHELVDIVSVHGLAVLGAVPGIDMSVKFQAALEKCAGRRSRK